MRIGSPMGNPPFATGGKLGRSKRPSGLKYGRGLLGNNLFIWRFVMNGAPSYSEILWVLPYLRAPAQRRLARK